MNVSFRQLQYVRTAADSGSIRRASERLRISQSSIRAAIDRVEEEFGVRIFVRQPSKGLTVTRSGRNLLQRIAGLLAEVDSFAIDASILNDTLTGELNIGCFAPFSPQFLPSIFRDMMDKYPAISIHLYEGDMREVQRLLIDGTVDVILSYDVGLSQQISSIELGEAPPYVVLSEHDPLTKQESVALADLEGKPMILLDLPESRTYFALLFQSVGSQPNIAHRTETYEMVRSLVAAGLGFSLLNLRPVIDETYDGSNVVCRPLSDKLRPLRFIIGRRRNDFSTPLVKAFNDSCQKYFKSQNVSRHTVTLDSKRQQGNEDRNP